MEAKELRQFTVPELTGRIRQWEEELFRLRFKAQSSEAKDTSQFGKLRKDIARAMTIVREMSLRGSHHASLVAGSATEATHAPSNESVVPKLEAKPVKVKVSAEIPETQTKKKTTKTKSAEKATTKKSAKKKKEE